MKKIAFVILILSLAALGYSGRYLKQVTLEHEAAAASLANAKAELAKAEARLAKTKATVAGPTSRSSDPEEAVLQGLAVVRGAEDEAAIRITGIRAQRGSLSSAGAPLASVFAATDSSKLAIAPIEFSMNVLSFAGFERMISRLAEHAIAFGDGRIDADQGAGVVATLRLGLLAKTPGNAAISVGTPGAPPPVAPESYGPQPKINTSATSPITGAVSK